MAEQAPATGGTATGTGSSGGGTSTVAQPQQPPPPGIEGLLVTFVPLMIIFYLFFIRPQNKERRKKEELLSSVKVKDRVITIGGLHGVVTEVEGDEVVLLVDSKKDVKMRFRRSAINEVLQQEEKK